jgi:hypothetical protein
MRHDGVARLSLALAFVVGCSGVSESTQTVGAPLAARPPDCAIEILETRPAREYRVVANIDAYVRRNKITGGLRGVAEEAYPELRRQGCAVGAQAVLILDQTVSKSGEFKLLYVKAVAIEYEPKP